MKPLMFVPPAQAEALSDAQGEAARGDRLTPLPWLDEDAPEDLVLFTAPHPREGDGRAFIRPAPPSLQAA